MKFTSPEQVIESEKFLAKMEKPACPGCRHGVRMCHHTPCMGTPEDMEKLIDAGYAKDLMLDWWMGSKLADETAGLISNDSKTRESIAGRNNPFSDDVPYLVPAIKGRGGMSAPFSKSGSCTLLVNNQCSLHDKGLKPTQGQFACCKIERLWVDDEGNQQELDERIPMLRLWNTQRGKDIIKRWKKEVKYKGEDSLMKPGLVDILDALIGLVDPDSTAEVRGGITPMTEEEYQEHKKSKRQEIYLRPSIKP